MPLFLRRLPLILALWAAFALRLFRLEAQSIWWDEGISLHLATSSWLEIAANRVVNIHPPLYFWLLKAWVELVGVGAFHGRFLSVLASLLQVALVYALARRWFGNGRAPWLALLFILLSPISVIYAQEIRAYAFLPLVYFLLLGLTQQVLAQQGQRRAPLLALALTAWVGLHLHYIVLFVVAYVNAWALLYALRRRAWLLLRRWLVAQAGVALASLPWATAVLLNWGRVQAEVTSNTYLSQPAPPGFLLGQVWGFHLTGLASVMGEPVARWLALAVAVLLLLLLLWRLAQPESRGPTAVLLLHWLVPLGLAVLVWNVRTASHPRYILMYTMGLLPLLAYAMVGEQGQRHAGHGQDGEGKGYKGFLAALLALAYLALTLWALGVYFFHPTLAKKDDMRGVAHFLQETAVADDLILVPYTDWSLEFEYNGAAFVAMPTITDPAQFWPQLHEWTQTRRRVFLVSYPGNPGTDWQNALPFALEKAGWLVADTRFEGLRVREYHLQEAVALPPLTPTAVQFQGIALTGFWLQTAVAADNGIPIALRWRVSAPTAAWHSARLTLLDVDDWPLTYQDVLLLDANGRPTAAWPLNKEILTYAFLPIPPATPPLSYTVALEMGVTDATFVLNMVDLLNEQGNPQGRQWPLGAVTLLPEGLGTGSWYASAPPISPLPQPIPVLDGLNLLGFRADRREVSPGQTLFAQLHWQAASAGLPAIVPELLLVQAGQVIAAAGPPTVLGRYPLNQWRAGEQVLEHRVLPIPVGAAGAVEVVLRVGDQQWVLAEARILETTHQFTPPPIANLLNVNFGGVARLVGYELPTTSVRSSEGVALTLIWQSLTTGMAINYTVFTHVISPEGALVGQHDAPPLNGGRPTSGWVADEYLLDPHQLTFREPYQGEARIAVGLYDPTTGARLLTESGEDAFYLPVTLMVSGE